ncbi:hypothetical protein [Actinomadura rupiterrae]|uniref:hypothetical protein n=1 Tax=Actinomadura rupiterrae TaxID=559627 RepID=UPI0020A4489E|nr:hypothetical protein [Actinomadura rupiterrae]MCP2340178.1 hypothetical protein [Actinomadura rupiterrae]
MNNLIPARTWVLSAGGSLGQVVGHDRWRGADWYFVSFRDITLPYSGMAERVNAESVKPAVLGDNVCRKRWLECFCGLKHIPDPQLLDAQTKKLTAARD